MEVSTVQEIDRIKYPILVAPFYDKYITVMVKQLSHVECRSIGDFSVIRDFHREVSDSKSIDYIKMREYMDLQSGIVEAALVKPMYREIVELTNTRESFDRIRSELDEIWKLIESTKTGPKRSRLEVDHARLQIIMDTVLPDNFMAFIASYSLGIDKTDVDKLSEDILRNAAVMAELAHDNPADHIGGRFERWPGDKLFTEDINVRARYILAEERRLKNLSKGGALGN